MKEDRLARNLAAAALGVALIALVLAIWSVVLGQRDRDDMRALGESLSAALRTHGAPPPTPLRLERPPPAIDPGDR